MVKKPIITERVNLFEPNDAIAMKFTISGHAYISYGERLIGIATLKKQMNISYQVRTDENTKVEMNKFHKIMEELKK